MSLFYREPYDRYIGSAIQISVSEPKLSTEERVKDLVSRMTLDEKISQMMYQSSAIERLGIPSYNWWNECLHGVARAGRLLFFHKGLVWQLLLMMN